jgi:hypothetical protein
MINVYYTATEGRRNACGHTHTRGTVYIIKRGTPDTLENIGTFDHTSGGAGIELSILTIIQNYGINTNGGYYKNWREAVNIIEI